MAQERRFRTSTDEGAGVILFPAVNDLRCRLKKITTTDEGAVSLAVELVVTDDEELDQIRDLIRVQQGEVKLTIRGVQAEMPV